MVNEIVYVPTYQVVRPKSKTKDLFGYVIPTGAACTAATIAAGALIKENRGDTFVSTAKKCVKYYGESNKKFNVEFLDFIGAKGLGKKLKNFSNKKYTALLMGTDILLNGLLCGWLIGFIKNK